MLLTVPLIRTITNWGLEQVCREVSPERGVWMKQALVGQEMYREQDNSRLEWPGSISSIMLNELRKAVPDGGKI